VRDVVNESALPIEPRRASLHNGVAERESDTLSRAGTFDEEAA
jgi:hypothetical protein